MPFGLTARAHGDRATSREARLEDSFRHETQELRGCAGCAPRCTVEPLGSSTPAKLSMDREYAPTMKNDIATELKNELKGRVQELQALRDEIRVQLHLAGMDAKARWAEIEPQVEHLEKAAANTVTEATRAALTETIKRLLKFRSSLPASRA
jgi:molecular chaperone GrpE (heat shock protein)